MKKKDYNVHDSDTSRTAMSIRQAAQRPNPKAQDYESWDFNLCGLRKLKHHSHKFEGPLPNEVSFLELVQARQWLQSSFGVPILGVRKCKEVLKPFTRKTLGDFRVELVTTLDPRSHISWATDRDTCWWSLGGAYPYKLHGSSLLVIQFYVFKAILIAGSSTTDAPSLAKNTKTARPCNFRFVQTENERLQWDMLYPREELHTHANDPRQLLGHNA